MVVGFVKVCGITSEEDALLAVAMGADAIGFHFGPTSRQVRPVDVYDIVRRIPPEITTVGVFVNEDPARVAKISHQCNLKVAQLHGAFTAENVRAVRRVVRAVFCAFEQHDQRLERIRDYPCDAIVVKAVPRPGEDAPFDWEQSAVPSHSAKWILGAQQPESVAQVIADYEPWGVDALGGVEEEAGKKDARLLRSYVANATAAFAELERSNPGHHNNAELYDWRDDGT